VLSLCDVVVVGGHEGWMDNLPNPATAERNQERKAAFIPAWPIVGAFLVVLGLVLYAAL